MPSVTTFFKKIRSLPSKASYLLLALPYGWLLIFFLLPFLIVLKISFSEAVIDLPPYTALLSWGNEHVLKIRLVLENYFSFFKEPLYQQSFLQSLRMASLSTLFCLALGYPMAYAIALQKEHHQKTLLFLIMLPFWTSFLLRVYAWMIVLSRDGPLNTLLIKLGMISEPLSLLYTPFSIGLGMVYCYLPFMILPLYVSLSRFDWTLLEAARDLGAKPLKIFFSLLLPLTKYGIMAGCLLVFIPCLGEFVIPEILGSSDTLLLGKMVWTEFFNNRNWPMAATLSMIMIVLLIVPLAIINARYKEAPS